MRVKRKFLIGGVIIFLALGYLGYMGFQSSASYYYTVSELMQQGNSAYGENLRVNGQVVPGSISEESGGRVLKFDIIEAGVNLPVVFQGVVPDTFKVGSEVVVEGNLDSSGVFQANSIMAKCPSRYVAAE